MEPTTLADDGYPMPFNWHPSLQPVPLAELVYGVDPCGCEGGWLPLLTGDFIACPDCGAYREGGA